ncbi:MAG: class I SAM-dependent methyltransferase [Gaiellaceae bacterium]
MGSEAADPLDFESFVLAQLPLQARVLEVGCGAGRLARALTAAGHSVTAIDPDAPEGPLFRPVSLEDFDEPGPFVAVVAGSSFHHLPDLDAAVEKIDSLLLRGGLVVLDEYAKERFDRRTAAWYYERACSTSAGHGHDAPDSLEECIREWELKDSHIHGQAEMKAALDRRFREQLFVWVPYLWRGLEVGASLADEQAAIDAGVITATGFRYVGEATLESPMRGFA